MSNEAPPAAAPLDRRFWLVAIALLAVGCWLRIAAAAAYQTAGTDELLYTAYTKFLSTNGVTSYPDLVKRCVAAAEQKRVVMSPLRLTHMVPAVWLQKATGWEEAACLNTVAAFFSVLTLPLTLFFATRLGGSRIGLATLALMVCAATQLFAAGRASVDAIVAFGTLGALWSAWECLQRPADVRWAVALAGSIAFLVISKENAIYILGAIAVVLVLNHWKAFGQPIGRGVLVACMSGLAAGYALLLLAGGGFDALTVMSPEASPYSIATGDGPWHRYLFDFATVSPLVLIGLAIAIARLNAASRPQLYVAIFLGVTYLAFLIEPAGMNLRYVSFWDAPVRFLVASVAVQLIGSVVWRPLVLTAACVAIVAFCDLYRYRRIFISRAVTDPITPELLRAEDIVKSTTRP